MRTFVRLLLIVLTATAATSIFYAVQQQRSLELARTAAESLEKERTELRNKLWEAERRRRELEDRLRAMGANEGAVTIQTESADVAVGPDDSRRGPGPRRDNLGRLIAAFDTPEAQRLIALQQKGSLDADYAELFRRLNLPPDQLEAFKALLVEKRTAAADVLAAARSQGLTGRESRDEIRALLQETQSEIDANIQDLLGAAAYQQYQQYDRTQPQRAVTEQLATRVSYLPGAQLSPQQSEKLVQIFAANAPPERQPATTGIVGVSSGPGGTTNRTTVFSGRRRSTPITDAAVQQAATILSPTQLDALRQLQAEQQAQTDLDQYMRNQWQPRPAGGTPSASSATPPKG